MSKNFCSHFRHEEFLHIFYIGRHHLASFLEHPPVLGGRILPVQAERQVQQDITPGKRRKFLAPETGIDDSLETAGRIQKVIQRQTYSQSPLEERTPRYKVEDMEGGISAGIFEKPD